MNHDHDDDRLTIGCPGCIEAVRTDQIVDVLVEWFQTCEWDEAPMPDRPPTPHRVHHVYRALRGLGYEQHDVRGVLGIWQVDWLDRTGQPTTDPALAL